MSILSIDKFIREIRTSFYEKVPGGDPVIKRIFEEAIGNALIKYTDDLRAALAEKEKEIKNA